MIRGKYGRGKTFSLYEYYRENKSAEPAVGFEILSDKRASKTENYLSAPNHTTLLVIKEISCPA